ncbi:hypothetical protein Ciccas_002560 [Cichlidogyrus casuarinus]|uniref:Uncharacterized protein n=1 Tax=Cichlidogyrus casuarinus TaxID=1844966 RepID=A0ABD2QJ57_9PLAT
MSTPMYPKAMAEPKGKIKFMAIKIISICFRQCRQKLTQTIARFCRRLTMIDPRKKKNSMIKTGTSVESHIVNII